MTKRNELNVAIENAARLEAIWQADDTAAADDMTAPSYLASVAADEAVEAARDALLASDEPRIYTLRDDGGSEETITAADMTAARETAEEWARGGSWDTSSGTVWIDVNITGEDGTEDAIIVAIQPEEPECSTDDGRHDWQSPHSIVGGLEENPGVHGHGGGVIITEICMHCGSERVTDTWAQRSDTGEQGLESVSYEEGKWADEVAELRAEEDGSAETAARIASLETELEALRS